MPKIITQLDMFRNADVPMRGVKDSTWGFAGSCFTAQAAVIHPESLDGLDIVSAQWRITWLPNITNGAMTMVRLIWADAGPAEINPIVATSSNNKQNSPLNEGFYITDKFKELINSHKPSVDFPSGRLFQFATQSCGDSTYGPLIYSSSIELVLNV